MDHYPAAGGRSRGATRGLAILALVLLLAGCSTHVIHPTATLPPAASPPLPLRVAYQLPRELAAYRYEFSSGDTYEVHVGEAVAATLPSFLGRVFREVKEAEAADEPVDLVIIPRLTALPPYLGQASYNFELVLELWMKPPVGKPIVVTARGSGWTILVFRRMVEGAINRALAQAYADLREALLTSKELAALGG